MKKLFVRLIAMAMLLSMLTTAAFAEMGKFDLKMPIPIISTVDEFAEVLQKANWSALFADAKQRLSQIDLEALASDVSKALEDVDWTKAMDDSLTALEGIFDAVIQKTDQACQAHLMQAKQELSLMLKDLEGSLSIAFDEVQKWITESNVEEQLEGLLDGLGL